MTKTERLNLVAQSPEERMLLSRILDKLEATRQRSVPNCTGFLSPGERGAAERLIGACGQVPHLFWGGYQGAERTLCVFLPDWLSPEDWKAGEDCPIAAIFATYRTEDALTHRDFLGALMGLGIRREKIGDILVAPGRCDILVLRELAEFLLLNLDAAGRTKLNCRPASTETLVAPQVHVKEIRDTVATLRLDAVAAVGFSLARSKAADFISAGRVALNHRDCVKPDRLVAQGDVIACRGLGKCTVKEVGGLSKKGRIMLVLEKYI